MEDHLIQVLGQTQVSAEGPRRHAEEQLLGHYHDSQFPLALVNIASHAQVQLAVRQSALLTLKAFVLACWSSQFEEFRGHVIPDDDTKAHLRQSLLDLSTNDSVEGKVQTLASNVVAKIAHADLPDDWPELLPSLLARIPSASQTGLRGALKVLLELVQDGFDEAQFFQVAEDLVAVLHAVASDSTRSFPLRALAVSVFKESFKMLEMILEENKIAIKAFAEQAVSTWMPFFVGALRTPVQMSHSGGNQMETSSAWEDPRGLVCLKIQVASTLVIIRTLFPTTLSNLTTIFSITWEELTALQAVYKRAYIDSDYEGRLEDSDGLPYTLDFLILENIDLLQACLRAPSVRKELEMQLRTDPVSPTNAGSNVLTRLMALAAAYSQITLEEEGIWSIDTGVFLAEETSVTTNYSPRIACGDMVVKLGDWFQGQAIDAALLHVESTYSAQHQWRAKEAALYLVHQLLREWSDLGRNLTSEVGQGLLSLAQTSQQQQKEPFLRARSIMAIASIVKATGASMYASVSDLLSTTISTLHDDEADIVQVSCIQALQLYLQSLPSHITTPLQSTIVLCLQRWINSRNFEDLAENDDLLVSLVETLRDTILLDVNICLVGEGLNLLFSMASQGADSFQMVQVIDETFEEICSRVVSIGGDAYVQLCQKVLPSLTGAFDIGNMTAENNLTNASLAAELLGSLAKNGPEPLPTGLVATVMPKLKRILLESTEDDLLRTCTATVRNLLKHDQRQVFEWKDETGKGGLDNVLLIVDRLLSPLVDDNAAAEVGGLAAEIVEKAPPDSLGPHLIQLLQAVAVRLSSAEKPHLIQSLSYVFARLSAAAPRDVVSFLGQMRIGNVDGLHAVMSKWLENSSTFAGYEDIRQNVLALCTLYRLKDPRLGQVMVRGDLVIPQSDQIMTRSKSRKIPDQYTSTSVPVKIIKLLVGELENGPTRLNGEEARPGSAEGAENDDSDKEDDEWEDEPDDLGTGLGLGLGTSAQELLAFAEEEPGTQRHTDDETQVYLQAFFRTIAEEDGLNDVYGALTVPEQEKVKRATE